MFIKRKKEIGFVLYQYIVKNYSFLEHSKYRKKKTKLYYE